MLSSLLHRALVRSIPKIARMAIPLLVLAGGSSILAPQAQAGFWRLTYSFSGTPVTTYEDDSVAKSTLDVQAGAFGFYETGNPGDLSNMGDSVVGPPTNIDPTIAYLDVNISATGNVDYGSGQQYTDNVNSPITMTVTASWVQDYPGDDPSPGYLNFTPQIVISDYLNDEGTAYFSGTITDITDLTGDSSASATGSEDSNTDGDVTFSGTSSNSFPIDIVGDPYIGPLTRTYNIQFSNGSSITPVPTQNQAAGFIEFDVVVGESGD